MTVNTAPFTKGVKTAQTALVSLESSVIKTSSLLKGLIVGYAFAGAAAGIKKLVMAGSDLVESQNKIKEIFGENSKIIIKASEDMQKAFGVSKVEFQDSAGVIGAILQGVGYAQKDAAQLAVHFSKLAVDAASFFNISNEEALTKIKAGLTGESEPLKALGVLIDENTVKQYAYAHSIAKVGAELTQAQKVQARVAIITAGLSKAQGDVARTADEVANASRGVTGRIEALAETIGTQLQPIAKTVLGEISAALSVLNMMWTKNAASATTSASATVSGIGYVQSAVGQVVDTVQLLGNAWINMQATATHAIAGVIEALAPYEGALNKLGLAVRVAMGDLGAAKELAANFMNPGGGKGGSFLKDLGKDLHAAGDKLQQDFEKASEKALPSTGINKAFAEAQAQLQKLRGEMNKDGIDPNKLVPKGEDILKKPEKLKEMKFAGSALRDSEEAANTILRSKFGGGRSGKELEKIAKNGEETNKHLAKIAGATKPEINKTGDYEIWRDFG